MAGVLAMQEVNADRRRRRVGTEVENVRQLEAQHVLGERQGGVEVRRRQHGVAQAHVAGDETRHALRRNKRQAIGAMAPAQFMAVARRIGDIDQRLHAALLDLGGGARLPFDTAAVRCSSAAWNAGSLASSQPEAR